MWKGLYAGEVAAKEEGTNQRLPRYVAIDRRQMLLRPVDVERLIEEEHPARALWELVGGLNLSLYHEAAAAVEGGAERREGAERAERGRTGRPNGPNGSA